MAAPAVPGSNLRPRRSSLESTRGRDAQGREQRGLGLSCAPPPTTTESSRLHKEASLWRPAHLPQVLGEAQQLAAEVRASDAMAAEAAGTVQHSSAAAQVWVVAAPAQAQAQVQAWSSTWSSAADNDDADVVIEGILIQAAVRPAHLASLGEPPPSPAPPPPPQLPTPPPPPPPSSPPPPPPSPPTPPTPWERGFASR